MDIPHNIVTMLPLIAAGVTLAIGALGLLDKVWTSKNLASVLFDSAIGACFLAPWLRRWI